MSSKDLIKMLKVDGWILKNVVGDHYQFIHPTKKGKVTVPHPRKDVAIGTLKSILKQAGL
jgi:predicted RNA binding protein YcfA (HicA-like mRNA interferase family)